MSKATIAGLLSLLVLLLAIAGCGGSDGDSSATAGGSESTASESSGEDGAAEVVEGGNLTRAEFIKAADAVCDKGNEEQSAAVRAYGQSDPEKLVQTIIFPGIRANFEHLGEMEPPKGDEAEVAAIVQAGEEDLQQAEKMNVASLENAAKSPFVESHKLAEKYGFKICGQY